MFAILKKIEDLTVTIVGLGVIGAAFAQSFREIGIKRIYGIDIDEETLKKAEGKNIINKGFVDYAGAELDSILPPTSRRKGAREAKKQTVLQKIRNIVEIFIGI